MSSQIDFYETLKKTVACIDHGDRQLFNQFGLTMSRFYTLKHIHENPGISLRALSALMLTDKSNTTRLIRSMQEAGLVQRCHSESDRRTYCLYLSDLGRQRFQRASAAYNTHTLDRFSNIDMDVEALISDLVVIINSLERS